MKKALFLFLILFAWSAAAQQLPISAYLTFVSPINNSYVPALSVQLQKTPGLMQSAYFNWGVASGGSSQMSAGALQASVQTVNITGNISALVASPLDSPISRKPRPFRYWLIVMPFRFWESIRTGSY